MMTMVCQHRLFVGSFGVLLIVAAPAMAQTVSLEAVAINGQPIEPTNTVDASPGDVIECEVYGSEWSPGGLPIKAWSLTIDGAAFGTDHLPVMPLFWDNIDQSRLCYGPGDCAWGEICWIPEETQGFCAGPDHHPEDGAFIDSMRSDYVFTPCGTPPPEFSAADWSTLSFRYASTLLQPVCAPVYSAPPKYFGTFSLEVQPGACGVFSVGLAGETSKTFFVDTANQIVPVATVEDLEINAGSCIECPFEAEPPNCAIDPRQPMAPDGSESAGWDSVTLLMIGEPLMCDPYALGPHDFSVREVPLGLPIPEITGTTSSDNAVTVHLSGRIRLATWTCVRYNLTGDEFCLAHLPGDVNQDGVASPADILYLIDTLNGIVFPSLEIWQCDIDRSGRCGPPDILRVIDLLNGAGAYELWLNRRLPMPCPSEL